jgi:hypothetical protein
LLGDSNNDVLTFDVFKRLVDDKTSRIAAHNINLSKVQQDINPMKQTNCTTILLSDSLRSLSQRPEQNRINFAHAMSQRHSPKQFV